MLLERHIAQNTPFLDFFLDCWYYFNGPVSGI